MKVPAGSHTLPTSTKYTSASRRAVGTCVLAALALVLGVCSLAAPAQAADAGAVNDWLGRINAFRASNGLGALQIDGNMAQLAQDRAQINGSSGQLAHTPDMSAGVTTNWAKLGENVGVGSNRDVIWQAFVNSPPHRANLLDGAFTHIGIGEVTINGTIWVTHRFLKISSAPAPAPAPVVVPQPAPAPQVVVPQASRAQTVTPKQNSTGSNSGANSNKSATNNGGSANNGSANGGDNGTAENAPPPTEPPAPAAAPEPPVNPTPNATAMVDALRILQQ